jgi:hypothetical protein
LAYHALLFDQVIERHTFDYAGRQQKTIERAETLLQTIIWNAATGLKRQNKQ